MRQSPNDPPWFANKTTDGITASSVGRTHASAACGAGAWRPPDLIEGKSTHHAWPEKETTQILTILAKEY